MIWYFLHKLVIYGSVFIRRIFYALVNIPNKYYFFTSTYNLGKQRASLEQELHSN